MSFKDQLIDAFLGSIMKSFAYMAVLSGYCAYAQFMIN